MNDTLVFDEGRGTASTAVLRARGRVDARTSAALVQACAAWRERGRSLVLNLKGVTFVSSSGLGALLALTEEYRDAGLSFVVAEADPAVRDAIELLNLQSFLVMVDSEAEALRAEAA